MTTNSVDNLLRQNDEKNKYLENRLLRDPNLIGHKSEPSIAYFSFDVPEISNLKTEFVYNYFVKNERTIESTLAADIVVSSQDFFDDINFLLKEKKDPRYVTFQFDFSLDQNFQDFDITDNFVNFEGVGQTIAENIDKLFIEGASSSRFFAGSEMIDTLADRKFYQILDSTIIESTQENRIGSQNDHAHQISEVVNTQDLNPDTKKKLLDVLSQTQPQGISYAPYDTRLEDTLSAYDINGATSSQSFSLKFNKKFGYDLTSASSRIAHSIFEDEIRAYSPPLQSLKQSVIQDQNYDPLRVTVDDYNITVNPVQRQALEFDSDQGITQEMWLYNLYQNYPKKKIVGYFIEKSEVSTGGLINPVTPLVIENPNRSFFVDRNVKYGMTYVYKVRTVALLTCLATSVNAGVQQIEKINILVASEGVTSVVECIEKTPPKPPENLLIEFDYKRFVPIITWEFPSNPQRDIKRFQIFKRYNASEPFTLIAEYDFDDSELRTVPLETAPVENRYRMSFPSTLFYDEEFYITDEPIYAVACVDAHGLSSNYSAQIKIKYNRSKNKLEQKVFSNPNAPKAYPNFLLSQDLFLDTIKSSQKDRMTIIFDPEYYVVTKSQVDQTSNNTDGTLNYIEKDLKLIKVANDPTYKVQIINTDYQQTQNIDIKVSDNSATEIFLNAAQINNQNLNFQFGLD